MEQSNKRVRMNFSETAKGLWQIDVTAETESVSETAAAASAAIDEAKKILASKGLKEVGE